MIDETSVVAEVSFEKLPSAIAYTRCIILHHCASLQSTLLAKLVHIEMLELRHPRRGKKKNTM